MAQVVKYLPSKCKILGTKNKKRAGERGKE
jgi:hypothetical protein